MSRKAFVFGLCVVVALIIGLYRAKYGAVDSAAEIEALRLAIREAEDRREMLKADLAHMSRREWIEDYAINELGMEPARAAQFARKADLEARLDQLDPNVERSGGE